jgi:hypothetical protein
MSGDFYFDPIWPKKICHRTDMDWPSEMGSFPGKWQIPEMGIDPPSKLINGIFLNE